MFILTICQHGLPPCCFFHRYWKYIILSVLSVPTCWKQEVVTWFRSPPPRDHGRCRWYRRDAGTEPGSASPLWDADSVCALENLQPDDRHHGNDAFQPKSSWRGSLSLCQRKEKKGYVSFDLYFILKCLTSSFQISTSLTTCCWNVWIQDKKLWIKFKK